MKITKGIVLRDMNTGTYYTGDYRNPWARDYEEAKRFGCDADVSEAMERDEDLFEGVYTIESVSVIILSRK